MTPGKTPPTPATADAGQAAAADAGATAAAEAGAVADAGADAGHCINMDLSSYDRSCSTDVECIPVSSGQQCDGQCNCPNAVINAKGTMQYQQALGSISPGFCQCPATLSWGCQGGQCVICPAGGPCPDAGFPVFDASMPGYDAGVPSFDASFDANWDASWPVFDASLPPFDASISFDANWPVFDASIQHFGPSQ
jgi:hypothetical protein